MYVIQKWPCDFALGPGDFHPEGLLQVKIMFRLNFFNLGRLSVSSVWPSPNS